jgi:dipeptide/tripeptide permease
MRSSGSHRCNTNFGGNVGGIIAPALTGFIAYKTQSFAIAMGIAGLILVGGILAYSLMVSKKVVLDSRQAQIGE